MNRTDKERNMEYIDNNKKYIIPFDSMDLSLLQSLNVPPRPGKDILPLWSIDNLSMRQEESYYEFEIMERDETECETYISSITDERRTLEKSMEDNCVLENLICQICNISVPAVCMSEHISSLKHRTFQKIAEIALDRVKKQMSVYYKQECVPTELIFCDSCSYLIPKGDKQSHLNSKSHRDAVLLDRFAVDLLKIYSADVNTADSEEPKICNKAKNDKTCDGSSKVEIVKKETFHEDSNDRNGEMLNTKSPDITSEHGVESSNNVTIADEIRTLAADSAKSDEVNNEEVAEALPMGKDLNKRIANSLDTDLNAYLNELNSANVAHKLEALDQRHLIVETKGRRMRVELAKFHGLFPLGKRHIQCNLCKSIDRDVKRHIYSKNHLDNLRLPIDENCIRELDEEKSHCVLCNRIIENTGVHALCSKEHENLVNFSLMDEESYATRKPRYKSEHTITENVQVDAIVTYSDQLDNEPVVEIQDKAMTTNSQVTMRNDSAEIFCDVCFISLDANTKESHCESPAHKCFAALKSHHLLEYFPTYSILKCKVCLTSFRVDLMKEHVTADSHQNCYKKMLTSNRLTSSGQCLFCLVCLEYISIGDELKHLTKYKHRSLTADASGTPTKTVVDTAQTSPTYERYFCEVCSVYMPGDPNNLLTHRNGARHKKNLTKSEINKQAKDVNVIETQTVVSEEATKDGDRPSGATESSPVVPQLEYSYLLQATDNSTMIECKVCKVLLSLAPSSITWHFSSYSHHHNTSLLQENSLMLCGSLFWCGRCDVHVPLRNQFDHIVDSQHVLNLSVKDKDPSQANKLFRVAESISLYALLPTSDRRSLRCRVCDVVVPDVNPTLYMHFCGKKHRTCMAALFEKNSLNEEGGNFNCSVCQLRVPKEDVFYHIAKASHLANLIQADPVGTKTLRDTQIINGLVKSTKDKETDVNTTSSSSQNKSNCSDYASKSLDRSRETNVKSVHTDNGQGSNIKVETNSTNKKPGTKTDQKFKEANNLYLPQTVNKVTEQQARAGVNDVNNAPKSSTDTGGNAYYCAVCDVLMTISSANLAVHNNGTRHKSNFAVIVKNKISLLDNTCFCDLCLKTFSRDTLYTHLSESRHIMMLNNM